MNIPVWFLYVLVLSDEAKCGGKNSAQAKPTASVTISKMQDVINENTERRHNVGEIVSTNFQAVSIS